MTAAPPVDEEIIAALRSLHERFLVAASSEPLVTVDFLHYGETDANVTALLRRDPVIGGYLALDQPMLNVAGGGTGYDLRAAIAAFLRRVQGGERAFEGEAKRLLRALRLTDGVVPVRVRTVLLGFSFEEPVALPFGQLFPATRSDLALPDASESEPPASVFETVVDAPAAVGGAGRDPWTADAREQAELALAEAADEPLGRLMVSLACSYANPVQERMVWVGPLYSGSQVGRGAIPIGSAWTSGPRMGYPTLELDRLAQAAAVVARVPDVTRIAIAARRYFQAITERVRPADSLIDYAIAIEAITRTSHGTKQRDRLVGLIGADVPELGVDNAADFKLVKDTRNDIVHSRRRPTNVAGVASVARRLVDHAITSAVRRRRRRRDQGVRRSASCLTAVALLSTLAQECRVRGPRSARLLLFSCPTGPSYRKGDIPRLTSSKKHLRQGHTPSIHRRSSVPQGTPIPRSSSIAPLEASKGPIGMWVARPREGRKGHM